MTPDPVKETGRRTVRPRWSPDRPLSRSALIQRIRRRLESDGFPRLRMLLLVSITGGAGFIASYALLDAGVARMPVRYFLAVAAAYLLFLLLLWLWLQGRPADESDLADIVDIATDLPSLDPGAAFSGGGGEFGGGGTGSSWAGSGGGPTEVAGSVADSAGTVGEAAGSVFDADDFAIPLLIVVLALTVALSSLWVVYTAPVLFAELIVDGVLAAGLYRRLRTIDRRHWLETALRRTFWPFLVTALVAASVGMAMEIHTPGADSIGDVLGDSRQPAE